MSKKTPGTVTIKDVAKRLGIAYSTVSRALNDDPHASARTKRLVRQTAEEMGYIPHLSAKAMRSGQAGLIGLIVPDIQNALFAHVAMALSAFCNQNGYQLLLGVSLEDPSLELGHIERLRSARANGILIAPCGNSLPKSVDLLMSVPSVQFNMRNLGLGIPSVSIDHRRASVICTQHLLQLGHRRIGYIGGPDTLASGKLRVEGMAATLHDADLALDPQLIRQGQLRIDFGRNAMVQLLNMACPPTAIVLGNSVQALGALEGLQAKGVHVPEDISLMLHGDPDWARVWGCGLTTIGRPITELASDVTSLLLQTIASWDAQRIAPRETVSLLLEPFLVMRGSTAPLDNRGDQTIID